MNRKQSLQVYMKEHLSLYVFVGVIFLTGVVFGTIMAGALSVEQKQELLRFVGNFFTSIEHGTLTNVGATFQQSFTLHMKWILIIWVLGMSVIGLPLILILDFLKGVLIGFSVSYLITQFSWKGMLFALVSIAPQNLFVIPALLVCSVTAIAFSIHLVKHRLMVRSGSFYEPFMRYSGTILLTGFLMAGVAWFEASISPIMMKWVTPVLITLAS